ncbi:MAG: hypothetical protein ACOY0T_05725 [Myxococcota bacterium]
MKIGGFSAAHAISHEDGAERRTSYRPSEPADTPASGHFPRPGRLFSQLSELAREDPDRFREVARQIASDLREGAEGLSHMEAEFDQRLADRFDRAAEAGDMSVFAPRTSEHPSYASSSHSHRATSETRSVLEHALDLVHDALRAEATTPPRK